MISISYFKVLESLATRNLNVNKLIQASAAPVFFTSVYAHHQRSVCILRRLSPVLG